MRVIIDGSIEGRTLKLYSPKSLEMEQDCVRKCNLCKKSFSLSGK